MNVAVTGVVRLAMLALATVLIGTWPASLLGHVVWTQVNGVTASTAALYHFSDSSTTAVLPESPLPEGLALSPTSALVSITRSSDVPGTIWAPGSLVLGSSQVLRTTDTISAVDGDLTVECWFKWTPNLTSSTLELGLASGARLRLARDLGNPANDAFGVAGTHGSFRSAIGFPNWQNVGEEEAGLNEWRHLGMCIHSTGLVFDAGQNHDVYAAGSVARIYLNGHIQGLPTTAIDISGLPVHDASKIAVSMQGGGVIIDEFAVWKFDWSENGQVISPFANGRRGDASVKNALSY